MNTQTLTKATDANLIDSESNQNPVNLVSNQAIFTQLLDKINRVYFRKLAGKAFEEDPEKKLTQAHYIILTVEHLLSLSAKEGYDLCKRNENIYVYNGAYWALTNDEELKELLGKAAEKMGVNKFNARYYEFKEKLLRQFLSSGRFDKAPRTKDTVLINLKNGTYQITRKGQFLRSFDKADFLTYQLPFQYDATAKAPLFCQYLNQVLPDKSLQNILSEYIGYVFVKDLKLEKVLLLYGSGSNGKSVFFEVVNALLGTNNVSNISLQSLMDIGYRAKIADKLLNYASEIKGALQSDVFKQLASGEPIEAKMLYKDPFIMTDYAKLIFNCNILPKDVEHTDGFFRRFLIVPFDVTITEEQKDPDLSKKIIESELSGVFNWVLEGLNRLVVNRRFSDSIKVRESVEKYRTEADTVACFLQDEGFIPSTPSISLTVLYKSYSDYCFSGGYKPVNLKHFKERLEQNNIIIKRYNTGNLVGLSKAVL